MTNRMTLSAAVGTAGGMLAALFGGWSSGLTALLILMGVDFACGLLVAIIFRKSKKTGSGRASSSAAWRGLCKKITTLLLTAVCAQLDRLTGGTVIRDSAVLSFCAVEVLSIIENAGLMGVPIPKVIRRAVEALREDEEG